MCSRPNVKHDSHISIYAHFVFQEPKLRSELMRALKYGGKISEIRDIVSSGADLNSPGTKPTLMPEVQTYPLMLAVCDRNSEAVQLMLDSGADPNICYEYVREGRDCCLRPLSEAARPDILTMLLDAGAEINAQMRSIHDTETALLRAAHFQPSIGDLLIERGADLNMRDESGRTALYRAINNFNHDLAAHLVQVSWEVCPLYLDKSYALQWRHNQPDGVSNHRRLVCLLSRLFRRRSKKISKLRVTGLCEGNSPVTGEFPAEKPVTRKMFPFDDVIVSQIVMSEQCWTWRDSEWDISDNQISPIIPFLFYQIKLSEIDWYYRYKR